MNFFAGLIKKNASANHAIFINSMISVLFLASTYFFTMDIYSINKGFSIWDEGYYLLSYKMAFKGFYPHFNNTPFVIARFFEWMHPNIIGYRLIHMVLSLTTALFFTYTIITYLKHLEVIFSKIDKIFLYLVSFYAVVYCWLIAVPTLSYNHMNEIFMLMSQSFLLLGMIKKNFSVKSVFFIFISGGLVALDIFIKPPTFVLLFLESILLIFLNFYKEKLVIKYTSIFFLGFATILLLSLISILRPNDWLAYLNFMSAHKTHSPYHVLVDFLRSAVDFLTTGGAFIVSSVFMIFISCCWSKIKRQTALKIRVARFCIILSMIFSFYYMIKLLFPVNLSQAFSLHWWFFWVYTATFLIASTVIYAVSLLIISSLNIKKDNIRLLLICVMLFTNPLIGSLGTVNGFGQVQIHLLSWALLSGISVLVILKYAPTMVKLYLVILFLIGILISMGYFSRQLLSGNFFGHNAIYEQTYQISEKGPLQGMYVDKSVWKLLIDLHHIIDDYPASPVIVMFDAPGIQYALNRPWVIDDPWLSNYEQPMTKDDDYNCRVIVQNVEKLKKTIFIVVRQKEISSGLSACLAKIGYPKQLKFLGYVDSNTGALAEPLKIYLHD